MFRLASSRLVRKIKRLQFYSLAVYLSVKVAISHGAVVPVQLHMKAFQKPRQPHDEEEFCEEEQLFPRVRGDPVVGPRGRGHSHGGNGRARSGGRMALRGRQGGVRTRLCERTLERRTRRVRALSSNRM